MPEPGTKTVRIALEAALQLQTIAALMQEMGKKFKPVEFLNGLVEKPIAELHKRTTDEYAEFKRRQGAKRPRA